MIVNPPPEAIATIAGGIVGATGQDGQLNPDQVRVLNAVLRDVFDSEVDAATVEPVDAATLGQTITSPALRRQIVDAMLGMSLIEHPVSETTTKQIAEYANALDVDEPLLKSAKAAAEGHEKLVLLDFMRGSWHSDTARAEFKRHPIQMVREIASAKGHGSVPHLLQKYEALEECPDGSWGLALHRFWTRHGFQLPGEKGAPPEVITYHDWVHVISGYDAVPEGEILVGAFMAANVQRDNAFSLVFFPLGLYEAGILDIGIVDTTTGVLDNEAETAAFGEAVRRGRTSPVDLLNLDHFQYADSPLDEVREQFLVEPRTLKEPAAFPAES